MHSIHDTCLILRKFEPFDVNSLWEFRGDPEVTRQLGGFSTGYSHQDLTEWIESHRKRTDEVLYAIVDADTDGCIGHVGLYQIDHRNRKAEFAILIGVSKYQGIGLGKKITRFMVKFGFDELNLNKITLTAIEPNIRAISLYERLGFVQDGVARQDLWRNGTYLDVTFMSLLRDDWVSSKT